MKRTRIGSWVIKEYHGNKANNYMDEQWIPLKKIKKTQYAGEAL